jgi:hypothetical protein
MIEGVDTTIHNYHFSTMIFDIVKINTSNLARIFFPMHVKITDKLLEIVNVTRYEAQTRTSDTTLTHRHL